MKRTPEKVLSIISLVFTVLSIVGWGLFVAFSRAFSGAGEFAKEFQMELYADPSMTDEDVELTMLGLEFLEGFSWFIVAVLIVSLIVTIVGMVFMWKDKNPKLAGVMFIIAGLFALIITPTSIMLYIAGILCFTRKPPLTDDQSFVGESHDDSMRPL